MQNRRDRLDHDTEQLLLNKSYHQLTMQEAQSLEGKFSEASYTAARKILRDTQQMFARDVPMPDPAIRLHLQKVVAQQKNKTAVDSWWTALLNYRIPMWQPVAGLSLMMLYLVSPWANVTTNSENAQTIVYKTDTVYQDKAVFVKSTITASTTPRIRQANFSSDNEDTMKRNSVLDTLHGVVRDIRAFLPAPVTELSDTATMTNDTASISTLIGAIFRMEWGVNCFSSANNYSKSFVSNKLINNKALRLTTHPLAIEKGNFII